MPPEATEQTDAGIAAFVRHFFAQRDYAFATGDVAPLAALGEPTCETCTTAVQLIDMGWKIGGWKKEATAIFNVEVTKGQPPGPVDVIVLLSYGESEVVDVNGVTIEALVLPAVANQRDRLSLEPGESSWLVSEIKVGGF